MKLFRKLFSYPAVFIIAIVGVLANVKSDPMAQRDMSDTEFTFIRLVYSDASSMYGNFGYQGWESWRVDWPAAETHFLQGLRRMTLVNASPDGELRSLLDDDLYDYPWIYALEVGSWVLSDEEVNRLREYLLRGGFLMLDDFHGSSEWAGFLRTMRKVFPNRPIQELIGDDEVLHVFYDLDQRTQIPGIRTYWNGRTFEKDGITPHWRGIYDDAGRLMVAINFNMDIGDAWEHADHPQYPEAMTALAYRFGINYVIYAFTH